MTCLLDQPSFARHICLSRPTGRTHSTVHSSVRPAGKSAFLSFAIVVKSLDRAQLLLPARARFAFEYATQDTLQPRYPSSHQPPSLWVWHLFKASCPQILAGGRHSIHRRIAGNRAAQIYGGAAKVGKQVQKVALLTCLGIRAGE
jgi:hypothetical protein